MKPLYIIKIGGNVIDNSENLHHFSRDFAALEGAKILVHGGGKIATELSHTLGIEPKMLDGRRITDIETLRIVTMVYAGLINKNIVAQLQKENCNAIGLTGADGNIIQAQKRPPIKIKQPITSSRAERSDLRPNTAQLNEIPHAVRNDESSFETDEIIDYGYVGDLNEKSVNTCQLIQLLEAGLVPVFSAITHDKNGQLLNTNADTIAAALATALVDTYRVSLVYCFEKKGVLRDICDETSVIPEIRSSEFETLKTEGIIAGGMLPKLENAFKAIASGVSNVYIGKSDELSQLKEHTFGTRLFK